MLKLSILDSKVTHCGWFAFEGFGRPFEAWIQTHRGWMSLGRALTYRHAKKKIRREYAA